MSSTTDIQIIDDIMQQIVSKRLVPGAKLSSENEFAEKYQVPRMTVRSALTKLEERGVVYSVQGKGRYLREKSKQIQLHLNGKTSFTEKMQQLGYELTTKNSFCKKIDFDKKIYEVLHARESDAIYQISRIRYIDHEPIAIHNSFVKESSFPNIQVDGRDIMSMFAYYRQFGFDDFLSGKTILSMTFPTLHEQQLLACNSMVPLIVLESNCIDRKTKQVLEYTKTLYRSDKFNYDITVN